MSERKQRWRSKFTYQNLKKQLSWRTMVYALLIGVFLYAGFGIASTLVDQHQNKMIYANMQDLFHAPQEKDTASIDGADGLQASAPPPPPQLLQPGEQREWIVQDKFNAILAENEDIVGWLSIAELSINYPVVQADDNDYYLYRDVLRNNNRGGSIFMDFRNDITKEPRNTVLYGHNMRNRTMFGDILLYESRWIFKQRDIIQFDTLYDNQKWKVFAAYRTNVEFDYIQTDFRSDEEYLAFLESLQEKSLHQSDIVLTANDRILTLSTCTNITSDDRFTIHAVLIQDDENTGIDSVVSAEETLEATEAAGAAAMEAIAAEQQRLKEEREREAAEARAEIVAELMEALSEDYAEIPEFVVDLYEEVVTDSLKRILDLAELQELREQEDYEFVFLNNDEPESFISLSIRIEEKTFEDFHFQLFADGTMKRWSHAETSFIELVIEDDEDEAEASETDGEAEEQE